MLNFKRLMKRIYYFPSNAVNRINYAFHGVKVGKGHETVGRVFIKKARGAKILLGENVRIRSKGTANPIGAGERTYFQVLEGATLIIGDGTGLSNCAITAAKKVVIGKNVRIGSGVKIYDTDFHSIDPIDRTAIPERGVVSKAPITIEDYAFIGAGSYILKGVTIGEAAVIGAASVVTKNVPAYEIWAGNPAKKIGDVPHSIQRRKNED